MEIPASLLSFHSTEPSDPCVGKVCVKGMWILLREPIAQWPKALLDTFQQDLYFLFPKEFKSESYNSKDVVCLCCTVRNCPKKSEGQVENRDCSEYRRGLCIEASIEANECEPLSLGSIARFHGFSKQRVHQIYNNARKRLITELAQDEIIQEYLADVFIGKQDVPTPDDIAAFIERAVSGGEEE